MPGGGYVNYAKWVFGYIVYMLQDGLRISHAEYDGNVVLYRAEAPFVLTSYGGQGTSKSGLGPAGGGLPLTPLVPTAPDVGEAELPPSSIATNDSQYDLAANPGGAVMVERHPSSAVEPAKVAVWAKFQSGNYQYVHRWEFHEDGLIVAQVRVGGAPPPGDLAGRFRTHEFYYRLDFDIIDRPGGNNTVQRSTTPRDGYQPRWEDIPVETKQLIEPGSSTTWRVINTTPKENGRFRSYELFPGSDRVSDGASGAGDVWVVRYDPNEDGADVGVDAGVLSTQYVNGQPVDGEDVVLWYCLRLDAQPREFGEEHSALLYRSATFRVAPRDFLDNTPFNLYSTSPPSP